RAVLNSLIELLREVRLLAAGRALGDGSEQESPRVVLCRLDHATLLGFCCLRPVIEPTVHGPADSIFGVYPSRLGGDGEHLLGAAGSSGSERINVVGSSF